MRHTSTRTVCFVRAVVTALVLLGAATGLRGSLGPLPCPWDLDGNQLVGITELLAVLSQWGTDPGGPPDFDGDGSVGINDLLELLGAWGPCPGTGPCGSIKAGGCFVASGTPGCSDAPCCQSVCAVDPDCCAVGWDQGCADLAATICGNCGGAAAGACCEANGTPGCDDGACCQTICAADQFCCLVMWDELCAADAAVSCSCP
jgi:hypothetical protein